MKILHVLSGGLDSTVLLGHFFNEGHDVSAITFQYGSRHNKNELRAATALCACHGIKHRVWDVDLSPFSSALLSGQGEIPEGHYQAENMRQTVVPFRNGIMLSIAAGYAESIGADVVSIGAHAGDHYIYPDCRPEFLSAMGEAISTGTGRKVKLLAPFSTMTKGAVVRRGHEIGWDSDMALAWTCYKGGDTHCGVCGACDERKAAFKEAGLTDYTRYLV